MSALLRRWSTPERPLSDLTPLLAYVASHGFDASIDGGDVIFFSLERELLSDIRAEIARRTGAAQ